MWCLLVSLLFRLAGFLCQWEVRLKKCNNAFSEPLLRDRAERSLAMPPPTGRQMALAHNKKKFFLKILHLLFATRNDALHILTGANEQNVYGRKEWKRRGS